MIISDTPPPANVKPGDIIKSAPMPKALAGTAPLAAKPVETTADKELAFRKRQKDNEDAGKTEAEKQAAAAQKAKQCEQMQEKARVLESGVRVKRMGADGESRPMEDSDREIELGKARKEMATACKG